MSSAMNWRTGLVMVVGATLLQLAVVAATVESAVNNALDRLALAQPEVQQAIQQTTAADRFLTADEREVLSTRAIRFTVGGPAVVTVLRDARSPLEPFWLGSRGFFPAGLEVRVGTNRFEAWSRVFDAGEVRLGVNSLQGGGLHYLIAVAPAAPATELKVTGLAPKSLRLTNWVDGVKPYADRDDVVTNVPPALRGQWLVRTEHGHRDDGRLAGRLRRTAFPSTPQPDHVVLTWSGDPRTTQAMQWRTSLQVTNGWVEYWPEEIPAGGETASTNRVQARVKVLLDKRLVNDREIAWHTAELTRLRPGSAYRYRVGAGNAAHWTEARAFRTAPEAEAGFCFVYMGDAQTELAKWGGLLDQAWHRHPGLAFVLIAGDLVNRGAERDDWDGLLRGGRGVLDQRPLVPVLGNHDCQGGHPSFYLKQFALPRNGPSGLEAERAYAFEYGPVLFLVLDSNSDPLKQTAWMEQQLSRTQARWKIVSYHHPLYSSAPRRDQAALRKAWGPLFDHYHVDLALQGHDHAYLRTYPMRDGQRVADASQGTVYVVSVSGSKMYEQGAHDYAAVAFPKVSTYQYIDVEPGGGRLRYRAFDAQGQVRDEFSLSK